MTAKITAPMQTTTASEVSQPTISCHAGSVKK